MLKNPLGNIFTDTEQKVLLYIGAILLLGFALQMIGWTPLLHAESSADSLLAATATDDTLKVDIRTAVTDELMALPGIGEKRSADIIAFRQLNPFTSVNQIMLVKGIGIASYQKMLPSLIRFGDEQPLDKYGSTTKPKTRSKAGTKTQTKTEFTGMVDLNNSGVDELCSLPGIGEVKAKAIVGYRTESGKFQSIEEIMKVKGIGAKTFEKIKARLKV